MAIDLTSLMFTLTSIVLAVIEVNLNMCNYFSEIKL